MLPRLKPMNPVCRMSDSILRIGAEAGMTSEITDESGQIEAFLRLLDGTRTCAQLAACLDIPLADVEEAVRELDASGFLEDARCTTEVLAPEEISRYDGNIQFFSHFCSLPDNKYVYQERLRQSTILLIGVGGGGSHILAQLVGAGVGQIVIVDHDRIELSNLNRQLLYTTADIGRFKVEAAAERCQQINPLVKVTPVVKKISSGEDVAACAEGVDLIVLAADEPVFGIHRWVNRFAVQRKIPAIIAFSQVQKGRCLTVQPSVETGCMDCLILHAMSSDPQYADFQRALLESGAHLPTAMLVPHAAIVAGLVSIEVLKLLAGYAPLASAGKMMQFNYLTFQTEAVLECVRLAACPTCGSGSITDYPFLAYLDQKWE